MNSENQISIYRNRIESLFNREYFSINLIEDIGYIGNCYEDFKDLKPTDEEFLAFNKYHDSDQSIDYKILDRKLSVWNILNNLVDTENNSIAELVGRISELQNSKGIQRQEIATTEFEKEYFLFFDTETTGIPQNWKAPVSDLENWPRLVQLAFILCDKVGNIIQEQSFIIRPNGFTISETAIKIHGITNEKAYSEGMDLNFVLKNFLNTFEISTTIIAHNLSFDEKIIGAEFLRNNLKFDSTSKSKICTMERSTNFCQIQGEYGYKFPKLTELYTKLFNNSLESNHNAISDVNATMKCFWEMKKLFVI